MKVNAFLKRFGLIIFFGLCITLLSGRAAAIAGSENDAKLNVTDVSIIKDGSYRLKVYNLTESQTVMYRSSDEEVASVSKNGMVTGLAYGNTVITATVVEEGEAVATLQCNVIIGPAAVSIKLTKTSLVLMTGSQKRLYANVLPLKTVEKPVYYSSDTVVAKVSSAGRIRALQPGSVQVSAYLENGQYSTCDVTVLDEADYAKYVDGKSIEEILAENAENADDQEIEDPDEEKDQETDQEPSEDDKDKESADDGSEKTANRDGSEDKTVQDVPNAVDNK